MIKKDNSKVTEQEKTNAVSVLNEFTHAVRYLQHIGSAYFSKAGDISARPTINTGRIEELQKTMKDASRKSEIDVKGRLDLERKSNSKLSKQNSQSVDKINESLSELVGGIKGPAYVNAVKRIQKITDSLDKLAGPDPEAAFRKLETTINDFGTTIRNRAAAKKQKQNEQELQITMDLKLIRKVAVIEELAKRLREQINGSSSTSRKTSIRQDSPYRRILHREESYSKNEQLEHVQTVEGEIVDIEHKAYSHTVPEHTVAATAETIRREHVPVNEHIKIDVEIASTSIKSGNEQQMAVNFDGLSTAKRIIKQQEIMESNINKSMGIVHEKISLAFGKERSRVLANELDGISDANVKLFIEINVYTDMLLGMKDRLKEALPENNKEAKMQREAQKKTIDLLLKKFELDSRSVNSIIADFAKKNEFEFSSVPIFKHEIKSIQAELYNIKDLSGNTAYKRLGADTLVYENESSSESRVKQIDEDYKEIIKRLGDGSRATLSGYEKYYADISELVITQLAAIGVQLNWHDGDGRKRDRRLLQEVFMPNVFRKKNIA